MRQDQFFMLLTMLMIMQASNCENAGRKDKRTAFALAAGAFLLFSMLEYFGIHVK